MKLPGSGGRQARPFVLLAAILSLSCATWQVETASPARLITDQHPRSVRVTLKDSTEVLVADPVVRGDSIAGRILLTGDVAPGPYKPLPVAVALVDVASVSVSRVDTRRTLMWLIPLGVLLGVVAAVTL